MSDRKVCPNCKAPLHNVRSSQENRLFFDFIKQCYENWPLSSKFKPDSSEHLRAYLGVRAGHSLTERVEIEGQVYPEHIQIVALGLLRAIKQHSFIKIADTGEYFDVAYPKSMSFDKIGEKAFNQLFKNIVEIVECDYIPGAGREFIKKP